MNKKYLVLILALMLVAFSLSFSIKLENLNKEMNSDLTGKAYNSLNSKLCTYCTEYCGATYPNSAGTMLPLTARVKSLGDGCTGKPFWAPIQKDIELCCQ